LLGRSYFITCAVELGTQREDEQRIQKLGFAVKLHEAN